MAPLIITMVCVNVSNHRRLGPLMLALLALLWAALAPALAQMIGPGGAGRASERVQICTSTGMAWVVLDPESVDDGNPGERKATLATSCDWCRGHDGLWLGPPAAPSWGVPQPPQRLAASWRGPTVLSSLDWRWPQPQGPPPAHV